MMDYELFEKSEKKTFLSRIENSIETLVKDFNVFFCIGSLEIKDLIKLTILLYERINNYSNRKSSICVLLPDIIYNSCIKEFESEEKDLFVFLTEENTVKENWYSKQKILILSDSQLLYKILYDPLLIDFNFVLLTHIHRRFEKTDLLLSLLKRILIKRSDLTIFLFSNFFIRDVLMLFNPKKCLSKIEDAYNKNGKTYTKPEVKKNDLGEKDTVIIQERYEENKCRSKEKEVNIHTEKYEEREKKKKEKKRHHSINETKENIEICKREGTTKRIKENEKKKRLEDSENSENSEISYFGNKKGKHGKEIKTLTEKNLSIKNKELRYLVNENRCNMTDKSSPLSSDYEFEEMERRRKKWGRKVEEKEMSKNPEKREKRKHIRRHKRKKRSGRKKRSISTVSSSISSSISSSVSSSVSKVRKRSSSSSVSNNFSSSSESQKKKLKKRRTSNRKFEHSMKHGSMYIKRNEDDENDENVVKGESNFVAVEGNERNERNDGNDGKQKILVETSGREIPGSNAEEWKEFEEKLKQVICDINVYVFHLLCYDIECDEKSKWEKDEAVKSHKLYYLKEKCDDYINYSTRMIKKMLKEKRKRDNIVLYLNSDYEIEMVEKLLKNSEVNNIEIIKNLESYDNMDLCKIKNKVILLKDSFFYKKISNVKYIIDTCFIQDVLYNSEYSVTHKYTILSNKNRCAERLFISDNCYVFRLITKDDFCNVMNDSPIPQILKSDLFFFIFYLKTLGIKNLCFFEYVTAPTLKCLKRVLEIFYIFHFIDINGDIILERRYCYFLCHFVLNLPLKFQYGIFLLNSIKYECVYEISVIISMLSQEPIFFYNYKNENRLKVFRSPLMAAESDLLSYYNIYEAFQKTNDKKQFSHIHFLNYRSLKKATSFFCKLKNMLKKFGIAVEKSKHKENAKTVKNILKAQTASFFYNVSKLDYSNNYILLNHSNNISSPTFSLHPLSILNELNEEDKKFIVFTDSYVNNECSFFLKNASVIDPGWLQEMFPSYFLNKHMLPE